MDWLEDVEAELRAAHRRARHAGRREDCSDPVCAHMERWLHFETRPVATMRNAKKNAAA